MKVKYLITGCAGFIGYHLAKRLLLNKVEIEGVDCMNDYYDIGLKNQRLKNLYEINPDFVFHKKDISSYEDLETIFKKGDFTFVIHLAAQAGIRYSIINPMAYKVSNLDAFSNIIELTRINSIKNFLFASSSSVYGNNPKVPFSESDNVDSPISLYAATKKANELVAHSYHSNFDLNTIGLRFFTVYGPYGRPDMAYYKFADSIVNGKPIDVYNFGKMKRDFTYIDDVINGIMLAANRMQEADMGYEIFNIGNSNTVELEYFIEILENEFNIKAEKRFLPIQPGDVNITYADLSKSKKLLNYDPQTKIETGLKYFAKWFKEYYSLNKKPAGIDKSPKVNS